MNINMDNPRRPEQMRAVLSGCEDPSYLYEHGTSGVVQDCIGLLDEVLTIKGAGDQSNMEWIALMHRSNGQAEVEMVNRQTDRQTDRQTNKQTNTNTHTQSPSCDSL